MRRADGAHEPRHLPHDRGQGVVRGEHVAPRVEGAVVGLHREHVAFRAVRIAVGVGAAAAVLLIGPEHDADRPSGPETEPPHEPHRLPRGDHAAPVVHGSLAHVPRIEVTAKHHDLVRPLAAQQLRHHVTGGCVGKPPGLHPERHHDLRTAVLEPVEHLRVFHAERGGRDLRRGRIVDGLAGVRIAHREGGHGANEARHGAGSRGRGGPIGADPPRGGVLGERRVEEHDLSPGLGPAPRELLERADHEDRRGDASRRSRDAPAQTDHGERRAAGLHQLG